MASWVRTRGDLNRAEAEAIAAVQRHYARRVPALDLLLDDLWLKQLHKRMFAGVWGWAGKYRSTERNFGVDPRQVAVSVRNLVADAAVWFRLVQVEGNGRFPQGGQGACCTASRARYLNRNFRHKRWNRNGVVMARTATTEQVAAALHVKAATVRKYAREHRLPFDTTPGGHRRFNVEEAVRAVLGEQDDDPDVIDAEGLVETVPYVRVAPRSVLAAPTSTARVTPATVRVHDTARDVEDWAEETIVV